MYDESAERFETYFEADLESAGRIRLPAADIEEQATEEASDGLLLLSPAPALPLQPPQLRQAPHHPPEPAAKPIFLPRVFRLPEPQSNDVSGRRAAVRRQQIHEARQHRVELRIE